MIENLEIIEQARASVIDLAIRFGPKLLVAILILIAGHFVARWIGGGAQRMLERIGIDPLVRQLLVRIARLMVFGLFLILALQNLGVELLPLIAGLGVAGAGIALAMQGVLGNLAAGLTIIFTRPFRTGEYISIANEEGQVADINLFNTVLRHLDQSRVVIPNRKIVGEILHNFGDIRQLQLMVGVAYDTDLNRAFELIHSVLQTQPGTLKEPAPVVRVEQFADSSVNIAIQPWVAVDDYLRVAGELNRSILEAFRAGGVEIPFPQREVRMLGVTTRP